MGIHRDHSDPDERAPRPSGAGTCISFEEQVDERHRQQERKCIDPDLDGNADDERIRGKDYDKPCWMLVGPQAF